MVAGRRRKLGNMEMSLVTMDGDEEVVFRDEIDVVVGREESGGLVCLLLFSGVHLL